MAVVTGASSGIGAATAHRLVKEGFHVVAAARRTDRLTRLANEMAGHVTPVTCDVTSDSDVAGLAHAVGELAEPVRLLVNNAGGAFGADPVESASIEDWQRMYDVNVLGTLRVTKALLPAAREERRRHDRDHELHRRPDRLRGRRRLRGGQARTDRAGRDAAAGAERAADPGGGDRPRHGADRRVRAGPLRRRSSTGRRPSTPAWRSRWSPTTSPTAWPGWRPGRTTSTSTGWWSARWPRPPSTRCTGSYRD